MFKWSYSRERQVVVKGKDSCLGQRKTLKHGNRKQEVFMSPLSDASFLSLYVYITTSSDQVYPSPRKLEESYFSFLLSHIFTLHVVSTQEVIHYVEFHQFTHLKKRNSSFTLKVQLPQKPKKKKKNRNSLLLVIVFKWGWKVASIYTFRAWSSLTILHHPEKCELGSAPNTLATSQQLPSRAPSLLMGPKSQRQSIVYRHKLSCF